MQVVAAVPCLLVLGFLHPDWLPISHRLGLHARRQNPVECPAEWQEEGSPVLLPIIRSILFHGCMLFP